MPEVTHHASKDTARVVVRVVAGDPNKRIHAPDEAPIRRVIIVALREPQDPAVPMLAALGSRIHCAQGPALVLLPGEELQLEGDCPIFEPVEKAFAGRVSWGARTDPAGQRLAILFVTINGHRLT